MRLGARALMRRSVGWSEDRRGATAVEFAMLAAPFVFMVFALIQLGLYFMVQVSLDSATAAAARALRTGHDAQGNAVVADGSSDTAGQQAFANSLCSNMSWLQSQCASNLVVDVRPLTSFSGSPGAAPIDANGAAKGTCFYSGGAGSAVEVRTYYRWQMIASALMASLQGSASGATEVRSTEVFRVEPNGQTQASSTQC